MAIFGFGKSYKPSEETSLLTTVYDFGMRSVIESLLRGENIPYIIKERGGSLPVITGSSAFGTDFFVRESDLDRAAELITPCFEDLEESEEDTEDLRALDGEDSEDAE